ncbi:hypothetical protein XENOCAPTIV_016278, partial [Xenoophorus captivus]
ALKGINRVMSQGNLGLNPMVINRPTNCWRFSPGHFLVNSVIPCCLRSGLRSGAMFCLQSHTI